MYESAVHINSSTKKGKKENQVASFACNLNLLKGKREWFAKEEAYAS